MKNSNKENYSEIKQVIMENSAKNMQYQVKYFEKNR